MNYLSTVTIGDMIGPETLHALSIAELPSTSEFCSTEQASYIMHESMSQWSAWKELWLYGIIIDDDMDYYIPDDYDTPLVLLEEDAA